MTKQGCLDYSRRPVCCKGWFCFWALNMLGNNPNLRPDKSGIIVFIGNKGVKENQIKIIPVKPNKVGSLEASIYAKNLINKIIGSERKITVAIYYYNEKDEKNPEKIKYISFEPDDRNVQI